MIAKNFERGQTVAFSVRVSPEHSKLHLAEVIDLGGRGVRVRCVDGGRELWLRAAEVRPVSNEPPPETKAVLSREPRGAEPPPELAAPTAPARPATSGVDALESQGIDPMAAWLSLGRELIGRAARDVERAEADVAHADAEVADARALLATTEAAAVVARDRLRDAVNRRAEIERRTVGAP